MSSVTGPPVTHEGLSVPTRTQRGMGDVGSRHGTSAKLGDIAEIEREQHGNTRHQDEGEQDEEACSDNDGGILLKRGMCEGTGEERQGQSSGITHRIVLDCVTDRLSTGIVEADGRVAQIASIARSPGAFAAAHSSEHGSASTRRNHTPLTHTYLSPSDRTLPESKSSSSAHCFPWTQ